MVRVRPAARRYDVIFQAAQSRGRAGSSPCQSSRRPDGDRRGRNPRRGWPNAGGRSESGVEAERTRRLARADGEQRERFVGVEPGELGSKAGQESETAVAAALSLDRHPCRRQRLDIAQHGTSGDLELRGDRVRGQPTTLPQQQHQRNQPIGPHGETVDQYLTQDGVIQLQARYYNVEAPVRPA